MPPKKPGIYLADYLDCANFFESFCAALLRPNALSSHNSYNPFELTPSWSFQDTNSSSQAPEVAILRSFFGVMDTLQEHPVKEHRVCKNAIEMALLDLWGHFQNESTASLVLSKSFKQQAKPCYFTVAMNPDLNEMISSAHFGLDHTPYLKLKMDKNTEFWRGWLPKLHEVCVTKAEGRKRGEINGNQVDFVWSVDANADWTPVIARQFLDILLPYKEIISMIEQPFPAQLTNDAQFKEWKEVKELYNSHGMVIFGDESVSTSEDVHTLSPICDGINIKLDKTGGVREALRTVDAAQKVGLKIWFGIMVSSSLSCTTASCLLPLSHFGGDLDGPLLVCPSTDKFSGGMHWDTTTGLCAPSSEPGLGLSFKV